jgi:hypothetical protein
MCALAERLNIPKPLQRAAAGGMEQVWPILQFHRR